MPVVSGFEIAMTSQNSYDFIVTLKALTGTYSFNLHFFVSPTSNCQLYSIGHIEYLIKVFSGTKEDMKALLRACWNLKTLNQRLVILDVHQIHCTKLESFFDVVTKNPYTSTNGSLMCLYIVNLSTT